MGGRLRAPGVLRVQALRPFHTEQVQPRSAPLSRRRCSQMQLLELHLNLQSLAMDLHCRMRRPQYVTKLSIAAEVEFSAPSPS